MNSLILNSKNENIAFHTSGSLVINIDGTKPDLGHKSSHQIEFEFFCELLEYYTTRQEEFDYEEFFDYITQTYIRMQVQGELQKFLQMTKGPLIHY